MSQPHHSNAFEYEHWLLAFTGTSLDECPHQDILLALKNLSDSRWLNEMHVESCECRNSSHSIVGLMQARLRLNVSDGHDIVIALNKKYSENTLRLDAQLARIVYLHSKNAEADGDVIIELLSGEANAVRVTLEGGYSSQITKINAPQSCATSEEDATQYEISMSWANEAASDLCKNTIVPIQNRHAWILFDSTSNNEMLRWPWELIILSKNRCFRSMRRQSMRGGQFPARKSHPPLRILLISPRKPIGDDAGYIDFGDCIIEAAQTAKIEIEKISARTAGQGAFNPMRDVWVHSLSPATVDSLDALARTGETFEIVHFNGHAECDVLYFESSALTGEDNRCYRTLHPSDFAKQLHKLGAELVVLTACNAGTHPEANGRSIAETLVLEPTELDDGVGIAEVVAMGGPLHWEGAWRFSEGFYVSVFKQLASPVAPVKVNIALEAGRRRMGADGKRGQANIEDNHLPRHYLNRPTSIVARPTRFVSIETARAHMSDQSKRHQDVHTFTRWWTGTHHPFLIVCGNDPDSGRLFAEHCVSKLRNMRLAAFYFGSMNIGAYDHSPMQISGTRIVSVLNNKFDDSSDGDRDKMFGDLMRSGRTHLIHTTFDLDKILSFLSGYSTQSPVNGRAVLTCHGSSTKFDVRNFAYCKVIILSPE